MEVIDILNLISIKYLVIVVLLIEAMKIYMAPIMKTLHSKWLIFAMSMIVAVLMAYYDIKVKKVDDIHEAASRMFISFLFTISFYSLIVKPTVLSFKNRFAKTKDTDDAIQ